MRAFFKIFLDVILFLVPPTQPGHRRRCFCHFLSFLISGVVFSIMLAATHNHTERSDGHVWFLAFPIHFPPPQKSHFICPDPRPPFFDVFLFEHSLKFAPPAFAGCVSSSILGVSPFSFVNRYELHYSRPALFFFRHTFFHSQFFFSPVAIQFRARVRPDLLKIS